MVRRKKIDRNNKGPSSLIRMTLSISKKTRLSPSPGLSPLPVMNRQMMIMIFVIFLLATTTTIVQAVPARMLSSAGSNKIVSTSSSQSTTSALNNNSGNDNHNSNPATLETSGIPDEEFQLESLKGTETGSNGPSKKSSNVPVSSATSSITKPIVYVKKPEINEETPALSDNANSLKYGGANADLEEALVNMAHIPPKKLLPSLSVKTSSGSDGFPLSDHSILQKRTRSTSNYGGGGGMGGGGQGMGLLSRAGQAAGVNLEVDYTPQDIAEYIFWMGDERGVELALNDFVQDGLITSQDAVRFLEDVKSELSSLRNRYASTVSLGRTGGGMGMGSSLPSGMDERGFWDAPARSLSKKASYYSNPGAGSSRSYFDGGVGDRDSYYSPPASAAQASSMELLSSPYYQSPSGSSSFRSFGKMYKDALGGGSGGGGGGSVGGGMSGSSSITSTNSIEDMLDYEEIVDKLRQADSKMREVALESIIYQLARELFSMGLKQSSSSSVPAFTKFIENLSVNGNIPKDLERSVLETLVQALVDAANERGLLNAKSSSSPPPSPSNAMSMEGQLSSLIGKSSGTSKPIIIKKKSV